eukprot:PhF_6_TR25812/c0_g1_i1/m.36432
MPVYLPVVEPPSLYRHFTNPHLLYLAQMISVSKSSSRSVRVVTVTRQSLFLCKESGAIKRVVSIKHIKQVIETQNDLLIQVSTPHSDILLRNDEKPEAQAKLVEILKILHRFHFGDTSELPTQRRDQDETLQPLADLPTNENEDVKPALDWMIGVSKEVQETEVERAPPPTDRTEEIERERDTLEKKTNELEKLTVEVDTVSVSLEIQRRTKAAEMKHLSQEKEALTQECSLIREEIAVLEISDLPRLKQKRDIAHGTGHVTAVLLDDLQRVQREIALEREAKDKEAAQSLADLRVMYDAMLLRKQDELDALDDELQNAMALSETLQTAVDNVVKAVEVPPPLGSSHTRGVIEGMISNMPPLTGGYNNNTMTSPQRAPSIGGILSAQANAQRDYFLRGGGNIRIT